MLYCKLEKLKTSYVDYIDKRIYNTIRISEIRVLNLFDYHIHSQYSIDGKMTMDEACKRAIELGLEDRIY